MTFRLKQWLRFGLGLSLVSTSSGAAGSDGSLARTATTAAVAGAEKSASRGPQPRESTQPDTPEQPSSKEGSAQTKSENDGPGESKAPVFDLEAFGAWVTDVKQEARGMGISAETLEAAFAGVEPIPRVIELDRHQPERTMTFARFKELIVTEERMAQGRGLRDRHLDRLLEVARRYDVPSRFIVALWGMESKYGAIQGSYPLVGALSTLAFEGRRAAFFRKELFNALKILEAGDVSPSELIGSWAGAMGQCQFMPSSYLAYAVDFDGDGRRDIWSTEADVFGSAANYLAEHGWQKAQTWGREVRIPAELDPALIDLDVRRSLRQWSRLGVRRADGSRLPSDDLEGSLVQPDGPEGSTYLVYENFRVLLRWNRSVYFGVGVGLLADGIAPPTRPDDAPPAAR